MTQKGLPLASLLRGATDEGLCVLTFVELRWFLADALRWLVETFRLRVGLMAFLLPSTKDFFGDLEADGLTVAERREVATGVVFWLLLDGVELLFALLEVTFASDSRVFLLALSLRSSKFSPFPGDFFAHFSTSFLSELVLEGGIAIVGLERPRLAERVKLEL